MTTIYIVKSDVGDYDEHQETSLCAVTTEEKASALVTQLVELNNFNCAFSARVHNEFRRTWDAEHQHPAMPDKPKPSEDFRAVQSALASRAADAQLSELKALFKKLQNIHLEKIKLFDAEYAEYQSKFRLLMTSRQDAEREWVDKNYIVPSHLSEVSKVVNDHHSDLNNEYSYYELTLFQ